MFQPCRCVQIVMGAETHTMTRPQPNVAVHDTDRVIVETCLAR